MSSVSTDQRHTKAHRCPICGGAEQDPREQGVRCIGYTSGDGDWARCSREEHAGALDLEDGSQCYVHKLHGSCKCGSTHGAERYVRDTIEAIYPYRDENGHDLFEVVRKTGKKFLQRRERREDEGSPSGFVWKLGKVRRVLYRLPELIAADPTKPVYIVEGEKDVNTLVRLRDLVATCNPGGALKWGPVAELARKVLAGRKVIIIADADEPGRRHARQIEASLRDVAGSVAVVECMLGKDVTDHLAAGGTMADLQALVVDPLPEPKADKVDLVGVFQWTDSGNAERLVALEGDGLRYVRTWKKFAGWTGSRWELDDGAPFRAAKRTMRAMVKQADAIDNDERRKAAIRFAISSESAKGLHAMVSLAKHEQAVEMLHTAFDADTMLFNAKNGTIDLRTGELRPHRREDYLTKLSPITYDPAAKCDRFEAFALEIMAGDAELVEFLRRLLGYYMTGDTREHVIAFWYGLGGNGKSLLVLVLLYIFGDYAAKAAPDLLFRSEKTDRHPTELCDLHGRRLIVCNETTRGRSWDEGTVKDVTGGDRLRARRMREDFWEWDPTHKIVVFGNHKPQIKTVDDAIRRRLRLVPFTVNFERTKDTALFEKLKAEASGILRWLVQGCVAWQKHGLPEAKGITAATADYMRDEDTLGQFFDARCVFHPDTKVTRKELRDAYVAFATERDEKPISAKGFVEAVRMRGGTPRGVRTEKGPRDGWIGIRMATEAEQAATSAWSERSDVVTCSEQFPYSAHGARIAPPIRESRFEVTTPPQVTTAQPAEPDEEFLPGEGFQ